MTEPTIPPEDPTPDTPWRNRDAVEVLHQAITDVGAATDVKIEALRADSLKSGEAIVREIAQQRTEIAALHVSVNDLASEVEAQGEDRGREHAEIMALLGQILERLPKGEPETPPTDPPPSGPWLGAYEYGTDRDRDALDQALADAAGATPPVSTFVRGFSGPKHPATFAASVVADAPALGLGAVLNTKLTDWSALAAGEYDALIHAFYESWPAGVWGDVTVNHEPENDGRDHEAETWCKGIARYVHVAGEVIRRRGLDVKVGGCLMGVTERWPTWAWWEVLDPADRDVATFGVDPYWKHHDGPRGADPGPLLGKIVSTARSAGLPVTIFETAIDRRRYDSEGGGVIGTDETCAAWLEAFVARLRAIPEIRTVCHFHDPEGPASGQAQLRTVDAAAWARACVNGRRA